MDITPDITTEEIQRQAIKILYDNLNTEITNRSANWIVEDAAYYASIGRSAPGFTVETISAENFYPGVVPSLILAPIENYPNVSAYAWSATPTNSGDDVAEEYRIVLSIEVMVKSIDSELEANTRIQKTLEAIHAIMVKNPSINGTINTISPPSMSSGDVFVRRQEKSRGDRWFWQGGRLDYTGEKFAKLF